jgi:hypothetical protein
MDLENIVNLSFEIDALCGKYGYKVSEKYGQMIHSDLGTDGGLTKNFWIRIEPKTKEQNA